MKPHRIIVWIAGLVLAVSAAAFAGDPVKVEPRKAVVKPNVQRAAKIKGPMKLKAFSVKEVTFKPILLNNQTHLAAAVIFNRNIDPASVRQGNNIRLLTKNNNNFWVDASTQNNIVRVRPNHITWVCGLPLNPNRAYKMHLRGTIKSRDGQYLDCNGDGKGEGGSLPAYESQTYQAFIRDLEDLEDR